MLQIGLLDARAVSVYDLWLFRLLIAALLDDVLLLELSSRRILNVCDGWRSRILVEDHELPVHGRRLRGFLVPAKGLSESGLLQIHRSDLLFLLVPEASKLAVELTAVRVDVYLRRPA